MNPLNHYFLPFSKLKQHFTCSIQLSTGPQLVNKKSENTRNAPPATDSWSRFISAHWQTACMMLALKSRPKYGSLVDTYVNFGMIFADTPIEMRTSFQFRSLIRVWTRFRVWARFQSLIHLCSGCRDMSSQFSLHFQAFWQGFLNLLSIVLFLLGHLNTDLVLHFPTKIDSESSAKNWEGGSKL